VFKLTYLKKGFDLSEPTGRARYAVEALKIIRALHNPVEREEYLNAVRADTGYSMDVLRRQSEMIGKERGAAVPPQTERDVPDASREERDVKFILYYRLTEKADDAFDVAPYIKTELYKRIDGYIKSALNAGRAPRASALYDITDEGDAAELTDFLSASDKPAAAVAHKYYGDCIKALEQYALRLRITELSLLFDQETDPAARETLTRQIAQLETEKYRYKT
jgi:DNA primase